ncbi:solute carrier family 25 member 47-A [Triplophysa rosa]|uniref:Solute carrier family 25 member 47-A n=1 Tax=Triplophysa rosa TaxID=992332 RepID=A0A9W7TLN4_TRIRA|nr:solute carrier family 25 member 47-A [Triplophysa rosa]
MHFADFLAGSIGGACGVAVGYPPQYCQSKSIIHVRIQTQKHFTGIWQCSTTTIKNEVHGVFKGMALPVTTISMTSSLVFGPHRSCLQRFSHIHASDGRITKLEIFLSGFAGGVTQISVMSPGDIVKVRLQCRTEGQRNGFNRPKPKYRGPIHCLLTLIREEGVLGLYKGAFPLACRDGPSFATCFLTYDTLASKLGKPGQKQPAGLSGTPMDVIKARLQMDGVGEQKRYGGFLHCASETIRHEGPSIFFRSLGINCLRAFPVNMVVFAVYVVMAEILSSASVGTLL